VLEIDACQQLREPLIALSDRTAQNREIAGLHYPSDREVGLNLAQSVMSLLRTCAAFQRLADEADTEWSESRS